MALANAINVVSATKILMEAANSASVFVNTLNQQYHPSAVKVWCAFTSVTTTTILASYNVSSLTDGGAGITTVNFTTPFASTNYSPHITPDRTSSALITATIVARAAGSCQTALYNTAFATTDGIGHFSACGAQ